ncbi:ABC transporter ATP-binding protein [Parafrankia sp. EUN1f]|uniref:ABC transporter ATP-binding protein n=1 Tax=Parafrankia sp. EUN1f TaxID=102897 RepID=UPI0001C467FA|nr:ABC transporter ATP-binding protein [Parafrankia sp. EUN1f]EFC80991.1 ABC transporter related protein [Parafrankia sp. EUN1f]
MSLLELRGVHASYSDGGQVLHGVDLTVQEGGVTALLGANGAGKTSTLRAVSGMLRRGGSLRFDGREITSLRTDEIARLGIAHVPQGRGTLTGLSALDNLRVGSARRRDRREVERDLERCLNLFPRLRQRLGSTAGNLSGGEQQMLAIARALMSRPRLLLLDEPSLGLAPKITVEVFEAIAGLRAEWSLAIVIVEQNADLALGMAQQAVVLESGRVAIAGTAAALAGNDDVRQAYLGG